jgi:hypothetical protein
MIPASPARRFATPATYRSNPGAELDGGADAQEVEVAGDLVVRAKRRPQVTAAHVSFNVDLDRAVQGDAWSDGRGEVAAHRFRETSELELGERAMRQPPPGGAFGSAVDYL